jgi:hypothetical protein
LGAAEPAAGAGAGVAAFCAQTTQVVASPQAARATIKGLVTNFFMQGTPYLAVLNQSNNILKQCKTATSDQSVVL